MNKLIFRQRSFARPFLRVGQFSTEANSEKFVKGPCKEHMKDAEKPKRKKEEIFTPGFAGFLTCVFVVSFMIGGNYGA